MDMDAGDPGELSLPGAGKKTKNPLLADYRAKNSK